MEPLWPSSVTATSLQLSYAWSVPVLLPAPDRTPLANSPIALAVCQVRTEPNPRAADHQAMLRIYEALGGAAGRVPRLTPPSRGTQSVQLGPGAASDATLTIEQPGWRFGSEVGDVTVSVLEDSFAVETVNYTTWDGEEGFRALLEHTARAVGEHLSPTVEARLGLRYVNQIVTPPVSEPGGWRGLIDDAFLGPTVHPNVGPGVKAVEGRAALDLGEGKACTLRCGSFVDAARPGYHTFLVDIDCYREGGVPFSVERVLALAEELNASALALFQVVVREELRAQFQEVAV